ncbi:hypothetical protein TNCV_628011 [Trichonephila clavipes]|nr:hypothetical protein TNCV_628011 [Trichonephila clavipes]
MAQNMHMEHSFWLEEARLAKIFTNSKFKSLIAIPSAIGSLGLVDCLTNVVAAIPDMLCACEDLWSLLLSPFARGSSVIGCYVNCMTSVPGGVPSPCMGSEVSRGRMASGALLLGDEYLMLRSFEY